MREIKFRGQKADGEWVFGSLIIGLASNSKVGEFTVSFIVPDLPCATRGNNFWEARMFRVKPETVGQFTELLDKSGKEIYEGDVIDLHVFNMIDGHDDHRKRYVIYKDLGFAIVNKWGDQVCEKRVTNDIVEYTVIGNIYDNPELLEGVKI